MLSHIYRLRGRIGYIYPLARPRRGGVRVRLRVKSLKILWREGALSPVDVDLLCYTPEDFEEKRKEISIVSESLRYGVNL